MFGWLSGILAGLFTWFVLNFLGTPFLEFRKVRQEIQEELTYLADIRPPSQSTFYGGTEEDYESEVRIFADAREKARRLGSKLTALYINWPLPYVLGLFRYDLDRAAKNLLKLSTEFENDERTISRYHVESALKLPHTEGWWANTLIEERKRRREAAEQRRKANANQSS